jgi:Tfp pilus assembly PilM family ATPase
MLSQKPASTEGGSDNASKAKPKCQVLVGGASKGVVENIKAAAKHAGLIVEHITPGQAGPANAYEMSFKDTFKEGVIALVDIGFKNTSVSILMEGEMVFSRVLGFGGDKLTAALVESLGVGYPEAEGIKVGLSSEVEENMLEALTPLARELRASIDFFEHQHDHTVDKIYFSGGTARSESIIQHLQTELMTPCENWNPTNCFDVSLPPDRLAEIEGCASQLTVALGVAVSTLI